MHQVGHRSPSHTFPILASPGRDSTVAQTGWGTGLTWNGTREEGQSWQTCVRTCGNTKHKGVGAVRSPRFSEKFGSDEGKGRGSFKQQLSPRKPQEMDGHTSQTGLPKPHHHRIHNKTRRPKRPFRRSPVRTSNVLPTSLLHLLGSSFAEATFSYKAAFVPTALPNMI